MEDAFLFTLCYPHNPRNLHVSLITRYSFTITLLLYRLSSTYIKGRRTLNPLDFLPLYLSNSRQLHDLNP